jgi:hypothetical protein
MYSSTIFPLTQMLVEMLYSLGCSLVFFQVSLRCLGKDLILPAATSQPRQTGRWDPCQEHRAMTT